MLKIQDITREQINDLKAALTASHMEIDHIEKSADKTALLLTRDLQHGNKDEIVLSLHNGSYCAIYLPVEDGLDESSDAQTFYDNSLVGVTMDAFRFADAFRVNEIG